MESSLESRVPFGDTIRIAGDDYFRSMSTYRTQSSTFPDVRHSDAPEIRPQGYQMPKPYRPVALLNTLGKILEAVVATGLHG